MIYIDKQIKLLLDKIKGIRRGKRQPENTVLSGRVPLGHLGCHGGHIYLYFLNL